MPIPLITALNPKTELVLTPFCINSNEGKQFLKPIYLYRNQDSELYEWEGARELMSRFAECGFTPTCEIIQKYLIVGRLYVSHSAERYVLGMPTISGLILNANPGIPQNPGDLIICGDAAENIIIRSATKYRHIQVPGFRNISKTVMKYPVEISYKDVITPPKMEEVRSFFKVPYEMALPEDIFA